MKVCKTESARGKAGLPSLLPCPPPALRVPPLCCRDGASQGRLSSPVLIKATSYIVSGTEKQEELCLGPVNTEYQAGRQTKVNFASRVC